MPLDQETLAQQLALLAQHRRTLAHLLIQAAQFSAGHIPTHIANGIVQARANIAHIKAYLRENGTPVTDGGNDEAPPATSLTVIEAERKIKAEQHIQDTLLATYISQIEELLLNKNLMMSKPGDVVRNIARTRTLAAFRRLDEKHNQALCQFLRDTGLFAVGSTIIDLAQANLCKVSLFAANLQGVRLQGADLQEADLQEADLQEADLQEADLQEADLRGANLSGANLRWSKLSRANVSFARLIRANLNKANLRRTYAARTNLDGANLSGANLSETTLSGTSLILANLQRADLQGANLRWCILRGADLQGANLQGADLYRAILEETNLQGAILPDGSTHP